MITNFDTEFIRSKKLKLRRKREIEDIIKKFITTLTHLGQLAL